MDKRKEIKLNYKEAGTPMGIVQVKNLTNGKVLLEATANVDGLINRHRFMLKLGSHFVPALQQDWNRLGEAAFEIEVIDRLDAKELGTSDPRWALQQLEAEWLEKLQPYGERGYHKKKG